MPRLQLQPRLVETEPASSCRKQVKGLKEGNIYFLMTSETSPSEVCACQLAASVSKLVCKYWLKVAGGEKTLDTVLFMRDAQRSWTQAL